MTLKLLPGREISNYQGTVERWHRISHLGDLRGKTCLDLGAHVGIVSLNMAFATGCFVHAYEPHLGNYNTLVHHIAANDLQDLIVSFNEAVWDDSNSLLSLAPFEESSESHTLCDIDTWEKASVDIVSPQEVFARVLGPIAYLKVNCEGCEHCVLEYLSAHEEELRRVERIFVDVHPDMLGIEKTLEVAEMLRGIRDSYDVRVKPRMLIKVARRFCSILAQEDIASLEVDTL